MKHVDESRSNREIEVSIYYPALKQENADGQILRRDAAPDMSGTPYPLILTGPNSGDMLFLDHLDSHGFVTAIVLFPDLDYSDNWDYGVVNHPQDMIFVLDQLATNPPVGLVGVIDTDHSGVTGYSQDGFFALVLSGVRIDPQYYLSWCEQASAQEPPLDTWYLDYACGLAEQWDAFASYVGEDIATSEDGLWQPITDERIRVVMHMAADRPWLYGERGLAVVNQPVMMIAATEDEFIPYQIETRYIYENLGSLEKSIISFIDKTHMMVFDPEQAAQLKHFATAFYGYYLQGRADYKEISQKTSSSSLTI
jgi:predicted dienelactone hydrolase